MNQIFLLFFGVTLTYSKPSPRWNSDRIVYFTQDLGRPDGYSYKYQTEFGNYREERGILRTSRNGNKYMEVFGSYGYTDNDGKQFEVAYRSDDRGYRLTNSKTPINHYTNFQTRFQALDNKQNSVSKHKPTYGVFSKLPGTTKNVDPESIEFESDIDSDNNTATNEVAPEGEKTPGNPQETPEQPDSISTVVPTKATNDTLLKVGEKVAGQELDGEEVGNRVGLPPGLIGSLLGSGG